MKRIICLLITVGIVFLFGCTRWYGPGSGAPNSRGDLLNLSYPGSPRQTTIVINKSAGPIFIDIDGHDLAFFNQFVQVNPGDSLVRQGHTYENLHITIAWWCQGCKDQLGSTEERGLLSLPGLYTGKPLVVDDRFLRGVVWQTGVIYNVGDPTIYRDDRGNEFFLKTGGFKILSMVSGPLTYFIKPGGQPYSSYWQQGVLTYQCVIDRISGNVEWRGQRLDFRILLRSNWRNGWWGNN